MNQSKNRLQSCKKTHDITCMIGPPSSMRRREAGWVSRNWISSRKQYVAQHSGCIDDSAFTIQSHQLERPPNRHTNSIARPIWNEFLISLFVFFHHLSKHHTFYASHHRFECGAKFNLITKENKTRCVRCQWSPRRSSINRLNPWPSPSRLTVNMSLPTWIARQISFLSSICSSQ